MYQIEIKKHATIKMPDGEMFSTKNLIHTALNSTPFKGMSDREGKARQSIRESVNELKGNPILLLEDAEFSVLLKIINTMGEELPDGNIAATGWPFQDTMIWDFCDEIRSLKSFKPQLTEILKPSENGEHKTLELVQ